MHSAYAILLDRLTNTFERLIDVIDLIADTTTIHINDINTLEKLTSDFHSRETRSSLITKFLIPRIKELHINLKIPIAAFSAIESACEASVLYPIQSSAWTNFPRLTTHMSRLCKLNIWLDHNEFCSWSVVNERAALSYLEAIQRPNINISINLPKLHPKWESAQRHFLRDDVRTPMRIHRRNRQRVHGIVHSDGRMETLWAPDFPVALELMYFDHGKTEEDRQANIEALERDWWKDGLDPVAEMRSLLADFQK